MRVLIRRIFEKGSFHGFAYLARNDIHIVERILWGVLLFIATYLSADMCWDQWERYKTNPTVFGVERIMGTRPFPYMGITMCPKFFDEKQAEIIIQKKWNIDATNEKYNYYLEFLRLLTNIEYDNLENLQPYINDHTVNGIDILETIWDISSAIYSNETGKRKFVGGYIEYGLSIMDGFEKLPETKFHTVITEVGLCVTTSFLYEYQNPLGYQRMPKIQKPRLCTPFDVCNVKLAPDTNLGEKVVAYIHNNKDIVPQDIKETIKREMDENQITNLDVELAIISAEKGVRTVPIEYRKCRFSDENNLKYFNTYRPILCRNECRINAAIKLCKCKPFFYAVGPGPICTVRGLHCLAKAGWKDTKCTDCMELCSVHKYTALTSVAHLFTETKFERTLLIRLNLPKMGMRRQVVFSIDQLVVAFGGALSLFLGCSFLSFAEVFIFFMEYLEAKLIKMYRRISKNKS